MPAPWGKGYLSYTVQCLGTGSPWPPALANIKSVVCVLTTLNNSGLFSISLISDIQFVKYYTKGLVHRESSTPACFSGSSKCYEKPNLSCVGFLWHALLQQFCWLPLEVHSKLRNYFTKQSEAAVYMIRSHLCKHSPYAGKGTIRLFDDIWIFLWNWT